MAEPIENGAAQPPDEAEARPRPTDLYQDITAVGPGADGQERLRAGQGECAVVWGTQDGWPVGVVHRFVWHEERIWVACPSDRQRVRALRRDGRSCVIVSSTGTSLGPDKTV